MHDWYLHVFFEALSLGMEGNGIQARRDWIERFGAYSFELSKRSGADVAVLRGLVWCGLSSMVQVRLFGEGAGKGT